MFKRSRKMKTLIIAKVILPKGRTKKIAVTIFESCKSVLSEVKKYQPDAIKVEYYKSYGVDDVYQS